MAAVVSGRCGVRPIRLALAIGVLGLGGCGLIDSDIADFSLRLPERDVTVDAADWQLTEEATLPAIDCGGQPTVCADGVAAVCAADTCSGACGGETCEVVVQVSLWNTFDLAAESPELREIDGQPLVSVTIERVWYTIDENTLDVDSPELTVYAAPQDVMSPGDPKAQEVGVIEPIPAGERPEGEVVLTPDGQRILSETMRDYGTPFNLIVGSQVELAAGDPIPTGRMVAVIHADAHAGL
jgi:hypothetical protein